MHFRKFILTGAAAAMLIGSVVNVSAAETISADYIKSLKETGKQSLIIDVDAYKEAYPDLAEAFGDNTDSYIKHYLTTGVYEGRTKGVLFDPLAYASAYGDVKEAYGDDISAIVAHYVNFGVAENRTEGTANGFSDIAEAEKSGNFKAPARSRISGAAAVMSNVSAADAEISTAANEGSLAAGPNSNVTADDYDNSSADSSNGGNTASGSNESSPAPAPAPAATDSSNDSAAQNSSNYHHTTSIYTDDESTLLRVEYYDDNNKLFEYSSVSDYDKDTNSYKETVYQWDDENKVSVPTRTDTYVNGELASSEQH